MTTSASPVHTTWHMTFGTYGARLPGGDRATVDRRHNQRGTPFVGCDESRMCRALENMTDPPVFLSLDRREFIEAILPSVCLRGRWPLRAVAAGDDHVHVLCDVPEDVHGNRVRTWLKRWLGEALSERYGAPGVRWWAVGGSAKPVKDAAYSRAAQHYVERQRTLR